MKTAIGPSTVKREGIPSWTTRASVVSMRSVDPSRPSVVRHTLRAARSDTVDHPGQRIPNAKAQNERQQRVFGSLVTDRCCTLAIVPLRLGVLVHHLANIPAALGIGFMGRPGHGTPRLTELLLCFSENVLGGAFLFRLPSRG